MNSLACTDPIDSPSSNAKTADRFGKRFMEREYQRVGSGKTIALFQDEPGWIEYSFRRRTFCGADGADCLPVPAKF